jgi:hypothetical protein
MTGSRWAVPSALFFLVLPAAFAAGPAPECAPFSGPPGQPTIRVCRQFKDDLKVGHSTKYRIWVEGTREPIELRLHNSSPAVVHLKDGDDQFVRTSGGRKNEAQVKVKSLRTGSAKISVHPYSRDVKQEAAQIAAEIAPKLAALQADFDRKRQALPSPEAMAALLDRTEKTLLEILSYPELGALRDSVTAEFRQARADLGQRRRASLLQPGIVRAAFQSTTSPSQDSALNRIGRFLARLTEISTEDDLLVELCITSHPQSGAEVRLHPQSYRKDEHGTRTSGKLAVFRGLIAYHARHGNQQFDCAPTAEESNRGLARCALLDLLYNAEPILDCDFTLKNCALRSGRPAEATCP